MSWLLLQLGLRSGRRGGTQHSTAFSSSAVWSPLQGAEASRRRHRAKDQCSSQGPSARWQLAGAIPVQPPTTVARRTTDCRAVEGLAHFYS
jgi:hypothetical protein